MKPIFIVDVMLGNLCRWLRMLGYDTIFPKSLDDIDILNKAIDEHRILITSDKELYERAQGVVRAIFVRGRKTDEQLRTVATTLRLAFSFPPKTLLCPLCNGSLSETEERNKECSGKEKVWKCESCGKLYWEGSHWRKIKETVRAVSLPARSQSPQLP